MTIAILCPTLDRRDGCQRMIDSVVATEKTKPRILFDHRNMMPTVQKWNDLAAAAYENDSVKLFMLGSDDMYFDTPGWDAALLDHYNKLENKIHAYALQDSRDPNGTPHPIVSREWIDALGYFVTPIFLHWFVDSWTVNIAKANGVFTHFKDYKLVHDKPSDRGEHDETHSRIRVWGWRDRDGYVNDTCQHFLTHEKARLANAMLKQQDSPKVLYA